MPREDRGEPFHSVFLLRSLKMHLCLNTNALTRGVVLCLTVYQEFDHLLEEQSPIESYIEWLDTMVDRCVVKVGELGREGSPSPAPATPAQVRGSR